MRRLISIPDNQKKWLRENEWHCFHFHNSVDEYWSRLMSNVQGIDDRFLPYESDAYSIIDDFYNMLNDSEENIAKLIPDALNGLMYDCLKYQFYEMAENIKNIHEELSIILKYHYDDVQTT